MSPWWEEVIGGLSEGAKELLPPEVLAGIAAGWVRRETKHFLVTGKPSRNLSRR